MIMKKSIQFLTGNESIKQYISIYYLGIQKVIELNSNKIQYV